MRGKEMSLSITRSLGLTFLAVTVASGASSAADSVSVRRPRVGEVRALALTMSDEDVVAFHRGGWLEARGQLLSTRAFPELFKAIGRKWTSRHVNQDWFAIPEIDDRSQAMSSDNPFRVLSPADRVTAGLVERSWLRQGPLSYWIFAGRDVSHPEAVPE
jgi:hypothetical protein